MTREREEPSGGCDVDQRPACLPGRRPAGAALGADQPDTARSLNKLAGVLQDQGDLQGARPLFERALTICEQRLGADHPDTMRSRQRLAAVVAALDEQ